MNTHATAQQKLEASANLTNDPAGNAFNKFDVNRDGLINLTDAQVVDHFVGTDYRNLTDQLSRDIATDGTINPTAARETDQPGRCRAERHRRHHAHYDESGGPSDFS